MTGRTRSSFFGWHTSPLESGVASNREDNQEDSLTGSIAKNQKKGKRKREKALVAISYINMQGGRKKAKWSEIEEQLNKESSGLATTLVKGVEDMCAVSPQVQIVVCTVPEVPVRNGNLQRAVVDANKEI